MTKKKTITKPKVKTNHGKRILSQQKIRGYEANKSFLHKVNKIVQEDCSKHESVKELPWYKKRKEWSNKELFESTSINIIG